MEIPRKHHRVEHEDQTFIKIIRSTNEEKQQEGATILGTTLDVSVHGVRVSVPKEIPVGCRIEVWAKSHEQLGTLKLNGKVVWCRELFATSGIQIGIQLKDDGTQDYKEYQRRVVKMFLPIA